MYLIVILLLLFFIKRYELSDSIKFNKKAYLGVLLLFVFMSGFRYRLGFDSVIYEEAYKAYPPLSQYVFGKEYVSDAKDVFWAILNSACKSFSNSFVLVQVVMAIFVNGVVFWFLKKHSSRPFLSVLLYFFTLWPLLTFEALREAMSVSFFIFGLDALIGKKNYLKYYMRVWPACFFHTFGFMTLIFPLITFIKPGKLSYFITFVVSIIVIYGGYLVSDTILPYITSDSIVGDKMTIYLESETYGTNIWSLGGILAIIIGYVVPIVLMVYLFSISKEEYSKRLIPFLLFMLIVSLFKISLPLVYRFYNYFYVVLIVAITESLYITKHTSKRALSLLAGFLLIFMVLFGFSKPVGTTEYPSLYRYYPYNSIFTKDVNRKTEALLPL